jgi:hypothetical protein
VDDSHMPDDVTGTLSDLERKLVDLERELQSVASGAPAPRPAAAGGVAAPAAPAVEPAVRIDDLRGQISDLVRFRDQLEAAARELVAEYDRLVERLQSGEAPAAPAPAAPAPAPVSQPVAQPIAPSAPAADQAPPAAGAQLAPAGLDESTMFEGAVVVDAGPFNDITTLTTFEQAIGRVPGAEDVYVRSFEGLRALIDVRLSTPVALVQALRDSLPLPMTPREVHDGRLVVDLATDVGT